MTPVVITGLLVTIFLVIIMLTIMVNMPFFPRLRKRDTGATAPFVSVLIPARNEAHIIADGVNAHRAGHDHTHTMQEIDAETTLNVKLAPGGGWAARIIPRG